MGEPFRRKGGRNRGALTAVANFLGLLAPCPSHRKRFDASLLLPGCVEP